MASNHSIERTSSIWLRQLPVAAHVKRSSCIKPPFLDFSKLSFSHHSDSVSDRK